MIDLRDRRTARSRACAWRGMLGASLLAVAAPALAGEGIVISDARPGDSRTLASGEQLLLTASGETLRFAGRDLALTNFTGILGYASESAYVVVIDGEARDGATRVGRGQMLLIPPYGAAPDVQRFDANRLLAGWGQPIREARPMVAASLADLAAGQQRGIFFGRLSPTSYNVTAPRGVRPELANRALLGSETIRSIRFDGQSDAASVERRIVEALRAALLAGDAEAVAALLDPMPFGGRALGGGAHDARLLAARTLIGSRDWRALLGAAEPAQGADYWQVGGARVTLRTLDDFAFIRTVEGG